jgi:hypothetical protein
LALAARKTRSLNDHLRFLRHSGRGRVVGEPQAPVAAMAICRFDGSSAAYLFDCTTERIIVSSD